MFPLFPIVDRENTKRDYRNSETVKGEWVVYVVLGVTFAVFVLASLAGVLS